jgi:hypothetical protein
MRRAAGGGGGEVAFNAAPAIPAADADGDPDDSDEKAPPKACAAALVAWACITGASVAECACKRCGREAKYL